VVVQAVHGSEGQAKQGYCPSNMQARSENPVTDHQDRPEDSQAGPVVFGLRPRRIDLEPSPQRTSNRAGDCEKGASPEKDCRHDGGRLQQTFTLVDASHDLCRQEAHAQLDALICQKLAAPNFALVVSVANRLRGTG
jgi:hypothetical protein